MYYPIYKQKGNIWHVRNKKRRYTQESVNTTPDQFKVIDDVKDEPTLKEAQEFVGGMLKEYNSRTGII
jgi:hypothetical protein